MYACVRIHVYVFVLVNLLEKVVIEGLVREVSHAKMCGKNCIEKRGKSVGSRSLVSKGRMINPRAEMRTQGRQLQSDVCCFCLSY